MTVRTPPVVGPPTVVRFPPLVRQTLENGLDLWIIEQHTVPLAAVVLVIDRGIAADPSDRQGLAGVTSDLLDEGAGSRDAIELAEALDRLGSHLAIEVSPDVTSVSLTALARVLPEALGLLADIVIRPHLDASGFARVVELRKHRLRQLSRASAPVADRTLLKAVFGDHPYGHGALGTVAALDQMILDDARQFWTESYVPDGATLIVAGDVDVEAVTLMAREAFGPWQGRGVRSAGAPPVDHDVLPHVLFVDRPGAAQVELRIGHGGPGRLIEEYHTLLVLDAMLGGQFSSRINRSLREVRGLTYGARTSFGFRRAGGSFVCETTVQADRAAEAASEVLLEFGRIGVESVIPSEELARSKAALSRGYVRNFETATQLARAAAQLAAYGLDDRTFDRFVPAVEAVTAAEVVAAARRFVRPDEAAVVAVGDRRACLGPLEALGRPILETTAEF